MPESSMAERAREGARRWLRNCGTDPDDQANVRSTYEMAHADHARWLAGDPQAVIDSATWYNLVDAVKVANGWDEIPLDWPAPHFALLSEPLRNKLRRVAGVADD